LAEDAPTDTFHIPSNASNKDNARAFLRFVVSANEQTEINNGANLGHGWSAPLGLDQSGCFF